MTKHSMFVTVSVDDGVTARMAAAALRDALHGHADFFGRRCSVHPVKLQPDSPSTAAAGTQDDSPLETGEGDALC